MIRVLCLVLCLAAPSTATAAEATLAVAANMLPAARAMETAFEAATGHDVLIASGSTGKLAAQIRGGAPFDIFLAADAERPAALMADGLGRARRSYAIGRLVLVGPEGADLDAPLRTLLDGKRVTLADPALAPYGAAAMDVLDGAGVAADRIALVTGENIGQVATYLATGNASWGFLALSLLPDLEAKRRVASRILPDDSHRAIVQDAVRLVRGEDNAAALAFWNWLAGSEAGAILARFGYRQPAS